MQVSPPQQSLTPTEVAKLMQGVLYEVKKVVVGQDAFLERVMIALLAQGHLLVEGVPGLAKTLTIKTLSTVIRGSFKRIQFTPDLVPADLIGTRIFNQKTSEFSTSLGPVFANLVLADEINRAPAKVQSALLEAMQERQVTIAGETFKVPSPFVVTEGTYALPEAQVDRFMMKVVVGYPTEEEEFVIVQRVIGPPPMLGVMASIDEMMLLQKACAQVYVDPSLIQYAVRLVAATREPEKFGLDALKGMLTFGASPRASINLIEAARALALLRGRNYVLSQDVESLVPDVLRHRMNLSYEAMSKGKTADGLIQQVMLVIKPPASEKTNANAADTSEQQAVSA
jgi:MoxR-like ATPase